MSHRISRGTGAITTTLGATLRVGVTALPAAAAPTAAVECTSATAGLTEKLTRDITAALANRCGSSWAWRGSRAS
jgi:hypothetical protein